MARAIPSRRPGEREQIDFLVYIQRLLAEGDFVATYKFALLNALADISVQRGGAAGARLRITTAEIAEKFIRYYWPQAIPYNALGGAQGKVLAQNTGDQAAVINAVADARVRFGGSLGRLRNDHRQWSKLTSQIARTIEKMPLWRLQVLGGVVVPTLYENKRRGREITLRPGIAFCFRRFYRLVVDLIQALWLRFVRGLKQNQPVLGPAQDLSEFLFGSDRKALACYKPLLRELQSDKCFYCQGRLRDGGGEVDHFIPWVRYPVDLGHNFVLADAACNNNKRDWIAAAEHLARWCERNHRRAQDLAAGFDSEGLPHDILASRQITRWAYEQVETSKAKVWQRKKDIFVPLAAGWQRYLEMDAPAA